MTATAIEEFWFENVGSGTWLLAGDKQNISIDLRSETRTYQGASFGSNGPSLSASVLAPTGTVSGVMVTGGSVWNAAVLPQAATLQQQPVNLDHFVMTAGPLANFPPVGTAFTFTVTPSSGPPVNYTAYSNAYTTERISITSPTGSTLADANLGQPLHVSWTLPTTFTVVQLDLVAQAFGGDPGNSATPVCQVSVPALATTDTSTDITIPTTCSNQPVTYAGLGITATGPNKENSFAIIGFQNSSGTPGPSTLTLPSSNPSSLTSATTNQSYSGSISATGGTGPYTWTVNGTTTVPTDGSTVSLSDGLSVSNNAGSYALSIGGTPTSATTVTFLASVQDSTGATAGPFTYSVIVNQAGATVSGFVQLGTGSGLNGVTITLSQNGAPAQTTTTAPGQQCGGPGGGCYSFAAVPSGNYTITPSLTGASAAFSPASIAIVVTTSDLTNESFQATVAYTVSGTVSLSHPQQRQNRHDLHRFAVQQ